MAVSTLTLDNLQTLNLGCTRLTDTGLLALLRMSGHLLNSLDLSSTNISGDNMAESTLTLDILRTLDLRYCRWLRDSGLFTLLSMSGHLLSSLDLSETNISGESLAESTLKLDSLKTLKLVSCPLLTDSGLRALLRIGGHRLNCLDLSFTNVSGSLLADWMEQQPLIQLRQLDLSWCPKVSAADVSRLTAAVLTHCDIEREMCYN